MQIVLQTRVMTGSLCRQLLSPEHELFQAEIAKKKETRLVQLGDRSVPLDAGKVGAIDIAAA